jgi:hypothetical protein
MARPDDLPYQVSFRYFADYLRESGGPATMTKDSIDEAYTKYKVEHTRRQLSAFFDEHRNRAWFRERYDPSEGYVALRERVRRQGREGKVDKLLASLKANALTDLSYDMAPIDVSTAENEAAAAAADTTTASEAPATDDKMDTQPETTGACRFDPPRWPPSLEQS